MGLRAGEGQHQRTWRAAGGGREGETRMGLGLGVKAGRGLRCQPGARLLIQPSGQVIKGRKSERGSLTEGVLTREKW